MDRVEEPERAGRARAHFGRDLVMGPDPYTGKEPREHDIESVNLARALRHEIVRNDPQHAAQIEDIPDGLAHDLNRGIRVGQRVTVASDCFNEGRFAAAIGSQYGDMFAVADRQADLAQSDIVTPHDSYVTKFYEGRHLSSI